MAIPEVRWTPGTLGHAALDPPGPGGPGPADVGQVDWLRTTLLVLGAAAEVERFRAAAAGSGVIPWTLDLERMEEDCYLGMAAPDGPRAISLAGARILARRLREAAAKNHQLAVTRGLTDRRCPLDLHRLLPVPPTMLALGPDDPASRAWLCAHWGTPRALRYVREVPVPADRRRSIGQLGIELWSADWSPWQALVRLRKHWPELRLELQPHYGDPADPHV